jgi:hypothetical protein
LWRTHWPRVQHVGVRLFEEQPRKDPA